MMGSHGTMTYIYLHVDLYGFHVGKYTSPIDPMGLSIFLYPLKNRFSKLLSLQVVLQKISDKYTSPRLDPEFSHPVAFKRVVGTLFLPVPVCDSSRFISPTNISRSRVMGDIDILPPPHLLGVNSCHV